MWNICSPYFIITEFHRFSLIARVIYRIIYPYETQYPSLVKVIHYLDLWYRPIWELYCAGVVTLFYFFFSVTGKRFGLMQIKTAMCHMLPRFQVSTCERTPQSLVYDPKSFIYKTEEEIFLSFKRISVWIFQFWNQTIQFLNLY